MARANKFNAYDCDLKGRWVGHREGAGRCSWPAAGERKRITTTIKLEADGVN